MSEMKQCDTFRERIMADPHYSSAEWLSHRRECEACDVFASEMAEMEQQLAAAMRVEVPADLERRILARERKTPLWARLTGGFNPLATGVAVAASLVLTLALFFDPHGGHDHTGQPIEQVVLEHIYDEPDALQVDYRVNQERVNRYLSPLGLQVQGYLGAVRFAYDCKMNGEKGLHMVLEGERGPVTVLVISNAVVRQAQGIEDERFRGVVVPYDHGGSLAIVGEKNEALRSIEQRVRSNIVRL